MLFFNEAAHGKVQWRADGDKSRLHRFDKGIGLNPETRLMEMTEREHGGRGVC